MPKNDSVSIMEPMSKADMDYIISGTVKNAIANKKDIKKNVKIRTNYELNIDVKGAKDIEKAKNQVTDLNKALAQGKDKYMLADEATAIKEATKSLQSYNKAKSQAQKQNYAKDVLKWTNVYKAGGGDLRKLPKDIKETAKQGRDYLNYSDDKTYNKEYAYSVDNIKKVKKLMTDMTDNNLDVSSIISQLKNVQSGAEIVADAMSEIGKEAEKAVEQATENLEQLYKNLTEKFNKTKPTSFVKSDAEKEANKKALKEYKDAVDEWKEAGGNIDDTKKFSLGMSKRYADAQNITQVQIQQQEVSHKSSENPVVESQKEAKQAVEQTTEALKEQQAITTQKSTELPIIKSYEQLKQVLEEIYEIDNKIQKHKYSLEDAKYGDLDSIQKYSNITYEEYNDPFKLEEKIEELNKFYKRVERATNNPDERGYAKNQNGEQELFEKSELEEIKYALGSALQQWADMGLEVEDLTIKMTKKFKEFAQDAVNDWKNNQENDRLYREEEEALEQTNKDLIDRREELTKLIYKGLVDSNGEIPYKKEKQVDNIVHRAYEIQNNWENPVDITRALEKLSDLLGLEIPQNAEKTNVALKEQQQIIAQKHTESPIKKEQEDAVKAVEKTNESLKEQQTLKEQQKVPMKPIQDSKKADETIERDKKIIQLYYDIFGASAESANAQKADQEKIQKATEETISKQKELLEISREFRELQSSTGIKFDERELTSISAKTANRLKEIKEYDVDELEAHLSKASTEFTKFPTDFSELSKDQAIKLRNIRNMFAALTNLKGAKLSDQDLEDIGFNRDSYKKIMDYSKNLKIMTDKAKEILRAMSQISEEDQSKVAKELKGETKQSSKKSTSSSASQSEKEAKEAKKATEAEKEKKKTQSQPTKVDKSAEEQSKKEEKAAEEASKAKKKLNDEPSRPSGTKSSEISNMETLEQKVKDVATAVDAKTTAFTQEKIAVETAVNYEKAKLDELIEKIKEVAQFISELGDKPIDIKIDEKTEEVLSRLKTTLDGDWSSDLTTLSQVLSGLNIGENTVERMQQLANVVLTLKSNLNNLSDGGVNFLSSINQLITEANGLKDLATVLKATKQQIDNAKKATGQDKSIVSSEHFDANAESMRDSAIESLSEKYSDVRMAEITRSEKGIVTLTAAIKDADGEWKKFTGHIDSEGKLSTSGITELAKSKVNELKDIENTTSQMTQQANVEIMSSIGIKPMTAEWNEAVLALGSYKDELGEVQDITMQMQKNRITGEEMISYTVKGNNGNSIIVGANGDILKANIAVSKDATEAKLQQKRDIEEYDSKTAFNKQEQADYYEALISYSKSYVQAIKDEDEASKARYKTAMDTLRADMKANNIKVDPDKELKIQKDITDAQEAASRKRIKIAENEANAKKKAAEKEVESKEKAQKKEAERLKREEKKKQEAQAKKDQREFDRSADVNYIDTLKNAIKVEKEYQRLKAKEETGFATSKELEQLQHLTAQREAYNDAIEETNAVTKKEKDKYKEYTALRDTQYAKSNQETLLGHVDLEEFKRASVYVRQAEEAFASLKNRGISGLDERLDEARQGLDDLNIEFARGSKDANQYEKAVEKLLNPLYDIKQVFGKNLTEDQGSDAAKNYIEEYVASKSGKNLKMGKVFVDGNKLTISSEFLDANKNAVKLLTTLNLLNGELRQTQEIGGKGNFLSKMFEGWKQGLSNVARYVSTFVGFYEIFNAIKQGAQTVIEFDTALTEMRKVSDETVSSLKNFQSESFGLADGVGTTALQIQQSTADFMRLGETLDEASKSAETANILLNVSEFESIDEATTSLIAMKSAFDDIDQMSIVDKLNQIGNNFAISTDGLASALQRSASALKTAGNDIDEAIALTTAGNAVVQDPDAVGAGKFMPEHIVICGYFYIKK